MILNLIETSGHGGAEQMLLRLADEYQCKGYSQAVCLRKEGWLAQEVRKRGHLVVIEPTRALPDFIWLYKLYRFSCKNNVIGIHSHEFAMNVRGALLGKLLRVPAIATSHGKNYYSENLLRKILYRLTALLANMVVVSKDIGKFLVDEVKIPKDRIKLIENGIDISLFCKDPKKRHDYRKKMNVKSDEILLCSIGRYDPVKGYIYLIKSMVNITKEYPLVKLFIAGSGPLEAELLGHINKLNLSENIRLIGYENDVLGLLSASDVFIMSSLSEGQPLALLEAAACEKCIIATAVGGIPEIIKNNYNGLLVKSGCVNSIEKALIKVINNPEIRSCLAKNALSSVENRRIDKVAEKYLALLNL